MITLRPLHEDELATCDAMDRQAHARPFVLQTGLAGHRRQFAEPGVDYLAIDRAPHRLCGYLILARPAGSSSIELRRILVDRAARGVGQPSLALMEAHCRHEGGVERIWLDVFDNNRLGIHLYEKHGYRRVGRERFAGRWLHLYDKAL
ncbi:MAG: GNAT family N-acetyltransferase [Pseudomonadota bacterium]